LHPAERGREEKFRTPRFPVGGSVAYPLVSTVNPFYSATPSTLYRCQYPIGGCAHVDAFSQNFYTAPSGGPDTTIFSTFFSRMLPKETYAPIRGSQINETLIPWLRLRPWPTLLSPSPFDFSEVVGPPFPGAQRLRFVLAEVVVVPPVAWLLLVMELVQLVLAEEEVHRPLSLTHDQPTIPVLLPHVRLMVPPANEPLYRDSFHQVG